MQATQILEIPQVILDSAHISLDELRIEIAVNLYSQRGLSLGKARELANMSLWEFRQLLAARKISPHYDESDLQDDVATLKEIGQL